MRRPPKRLLVETLLRANPEIAVVVHLSYPLGVVDQVTGAKGGQAPSPKRAGSIPAAPSSSVVNRSGFASGRLLSPSAQAPSPIRASVTHDSPSGCVLPRTPSRTRLRGCRVRTGRFRSASLRLPVQPIPATAAGGTQRRFAPFRTIQRRCADSRKRRVPRSMNLHELARQFIGATAFLARSQQLSEADASPGKGLNLRGGLAVAFIGTEPDMHRDHWPLPCGRTRRGPGGHVAGGGSRALKLRRRARQAAPRTTRYLTREAGVVIPAG